VSDFSRVAGTLGEGATIGIKGRNFVDIKKEQSIGDFMAFSI
jgi:hypothetical protein